MIEETITIDDGGLGDRLNGSQDIIYEESRITVSKITAYLHRVIAAITPEGATHLLRQSITFDITGARTNELLGKVFTNIIYGEPVEEGTKPHWAPIAPLKLWARRKLGDERIAYAIRWKIKRLGTKGAHMFKKGLERSRPYIKREETDLGHRIAARIDGK